MTLTKRQLSRWNAAKRWISKLKEISEKNNATIFHGGVPIRRSALGVTDSEIFVRSDDGLATYLIYEADPDYAHGLDETIEETKNRFSETFKLYKEIAVK